MGCTSCGCSSCNQRKAETNSGDTKKTGIEPVYMVQSSGDSKKKMLPALVQQTTEEEILEPMVEVLPSKEPELDGFVVACLSFAAAISFGQAFLNARVKTN